MDEYRPLQQYLERCEGQTVTLTYEQMESIIGDKLPMSAHKYTAWWANGGHYYAESWLSVGWKVDKARFSESVAFKEQ